MDLTLQYKKEDITYLPCNYSTYDGKNNPQPPTDVNKRLQP